MHIIQDLAEQMDLQTRPYSGRGMFGEECLAIVVDDSRSLVQALVDLSAELAAGEEAEALDDLRRARIDNMGRGTVIYFPRVPFAGDASD